MQDYANQSGVHTPKMSFLSLFEGVSPVRVIAEAVGMTAVLLILGGGLMLASAFCDACAK